LSATLSTPETRSGELTSEPAANFDLIISPGRVQREYWKDLWRYRELFYFLAWRDVLVRYKQAVFGVAWALVRPLITMILFTFVFGKVAKLPSGGVPYSLFVLSGMLPWQLFSSSLGEASNSVVSNANLVSKVYFPRMIIPAATIIVNLLDFLISFAIMLAYMVFMRIAPCSKLLILPFFILDAAVLSMSFGLCLAALNVRYRDFRYVIPFIIQFGLYASPVGYTSAIVPLKYRLIYILNPMVGIIDGFRWSIFGSTTPYLRWSIFSSVVTTAVSLWFGIYYFRKTERNFADVI
jgi:lipopolysaccharide transport system permease protein